VPRFVAHLATPGTVGRHLTRDMAGRAMTYLHARTHYGALKRAALAPLSPIWRAVLGDDDCTALDDLYARLTWIPDGENEPLSEWARRYRDIIGPPDPPTAGDGVGARDSADPDTGSGPEHPHPERGDDDRRPDVGSLKDALESACERARAGQLQQLNEEVDLAATLEQAARRGRAADARKGAGAGAPTGRMPDRRVARPPFPDEVHKAQRIAQRLLRARTLGQRRIDKRTPSGRFDGRA
jgi:hypothetical protein